MTDIGNPLYTLQSSANAASLKSVIHFGGGYGIGFEI